MYKEVSKMANTYTENQLKRMTKAELIKIIKEKDEQINRQLAFLAQVIHKYGITAEEFTEKGE